MAVLSVAVVVVGLIALLNLVLTMGVVRRLRDHTDQLSRLRSDWQPARAALGPGDTAGAFTTTDVAGAELSLADLTGPAVVGFFTPECAPCQELLPQFVAGVRSLPAPQWQAVAVIVVDPTDDVTSYRELLAPVARVVVEGPHGPVQKAFGAEAFPAVVLLDERHVVTVSGSDQATLAALPKRSPSPAEAGGRTEPVSAGR